MKEFTLFCVLTFIFTYTAGQFGLWEDFKKRADVVHNYEYKALQLSKEVRELRMENESLKSKVSKLISEKEHLAMNVVGKKSRSIASIPKQSVGDLVNFELYQWSAEKLLGVGEQALHFKKYEKSAQFYNTLVNKYKSHQSVNDKVLFEAGIAAYESKNHYDWSAKHFETIVANHPNSKYYRGAKLLLALSHFHQGDQDKFIATVNEFRKKYRNTQEWKVLSRYYEEINYRYNK